MFGSHVNHKVSSHPRGLEFPGCRMQMCRFTHVITYDSSENGCTKFLATLHNIYKRIIFKMLYFRKDEMKCSNSMDENGISDNAVKVMRNPVGDR